LFRKWKYAEKSVPALTWTTIAQLFSATLFLVSCARVLKHPKSLRKMKTWHQKRIPWKWSVLLIPDTPMKSVIYINMLVGARRQ